MLHRVLPPDSDASTVPASETEIQQKLAVSKKQVEPETSNTTDSQRPKLPQRIQSKELLKGEATSPNQSQGNPGVRTQATAVKAKAQPPTKVAFKEETETTAQAVAQCLARKSTAELNGGNSGGPPPAGSPDQEPDASDSEVDSDLESEEYDRREALVKAKKAAHARYMRFSRSLTSVLGVKIWRDSVDDKSTSTTEFL